MNEVSAVTVWLKSMLLANSGVIANISHEGIWRDIAPEGESLPYIIFSLQRGAVTNVRGSDDRALVRPMFLVEGVAENATVADRIGHYLDEAIKGQEGQVTSEDIDYYIQACFMEEPISRTELAKGGRTIFRSGGFYRIFVHKLPEA